MAAKWDEQQKKWLKSEMDLPGYDYSSEYQGVPQQAPSVSALAAASKPSGLEQFKPQNTAFSATRKELLKRRHDALRRWQAGGAPA